MTEPVWKKYLTDWNEGLGVVYERFVLNDYLDKMVDDHGIASVLEAPLYGMAGVSGINSVRLAERGCAVTLVDCHAERLEGVKKIWERLALPATFVYHPDFARQALYEQKAHVVVEAKIADHVNPQHRVIRNIAQPPAALQCGYFPVVDRAFNRRPAITPVHMRVFVRVALAHLLAPCVQNLRAPGVIFPADLGHDRAGLIA